MNPRKIFLKKKSVRELQWEFLEKSLKKFPDECLEKFLRVFLEDFQKENAKKKSERIPEELSKEHP